MNKISEAELVVMKCIWKNEEITSLKLIEELEKTTKWSKATIKTLLGRLVKKEVVEVIKNAGNLYLYRPIITESEYKMEESNDLVNKLYNGSINNMLVAFAKSKQLSKKDIKELLKLIDDEE